MLLIRELNPTRFVAAGYADWIPRGQAQNLTQQIDRKTVLELNDTPEKKGRNRRNLNNIFETLASLN
ncbi:MAG: hypothetical protein CM1200mP10_17390 [Candidatus Neomarinimicrobiota bacterium]|nr:MAG: hypothetical protein CM1200mP10_17390 [Candidatus Neomarinimicrobiota bacterium]